MEIKCAVHTDREASGACCNCSGYVCPECKVSIGGQIYCNNCVKSRLEKGSWPGQTTIFPPYASGMGPDTPVPPEIQQWNWGAFLMTWIWGIGNNVWISLIALLNIIPYIGWIASLVMSIILGIRGSEWAWQNKKWDSIEHFNLIQRRWMWWGIAGLAASILLSISLAVLIVSLVMIARTMGYGGDWESVFPWRW
jgi:hypothetical protein